MIESLGRKEMRRFKNTICSGLIFSALLTCSALAQGDEAAALLAAGDARGAMIRYERAVRAQPDDPELRLGLAQALVRLGEFERAEKLARVAYRRAQNPIAAIVLAEVLMGQERFGDAIVAIDLAKNHPDARVVRGLIEAERALRAGDPVGALGAVSVAASHPRFGTHARLIGARAQYARGDLVRSRRLVEGILSEGGTTLPALQLRAQLALKSGDPDRASKLALAIMKRDPGNVSAGAIIVEAKLRADDAAAARAVLAALVPKGASDPRPRYLEALILVHEGRLREASDVASTIEGWLKQAPGGAVLLGQIKIDTDRLSQAEKILRERVAKVPTDRAARRLLVEVFDRTDRADRGDRAIEEGLGIAPADGLLLRFKADRLMARGEFDEALEILDLLGAKGDIALLTALASAGDVSSQDDTLSAKRLIAVTAALRQGNTATALKAARAAVIASEGSPLALNLLATAQARSGLKSEAIRTLDSLIANYPNFFAAIMNRASIDGDAQRDLLTYLEAALTAGASSPDVLGRLAIERFLAGHETDALGLAQRVYDEASPVAPQKLVLARLRVATGDNAGAISMAETYLYAAQNEQRDVTGEVMAAAAIFTAAGAHEKAAAALGSIAGSDASAELMLAAANAHSAAGLQDDALEILARGRRRSPDDQRIGRAMVEAMAARNLGQALVRLKSDQELATLNTAMMRSAAYAAVGKMADARRELRVAPESPAVLFARASIAADDADRRAILTQVQAITRLQPANVGLLVLESGLATDLGDAAAAEAAVAMGLVAAPNNPILLNNLAVLRMRTDPDAALQLAKRAALSAPNEVQVSQTLIDAYNATGDVFAAERVKRQLLISRTFIQVP